MSVPCGSIDDIIDRGMPASGAPGLTYAVVVDGEITSAVREVSSGGAARTSSRRIPVPHRFDLHELHGACRHAAGRGRQDRPGRRGVAASRCVLEPGGRRHHRPSVPQPHKWLLHRARKRVPHRQCRRHRRRTHPRTDGHEEQPRRRRRGPSLHGDRADAMVRQATGPSGTPERARVTNRSPR